MTYCKRTFLHAVHIFTLIMQLQNPRYFISVDEKITFFFKLHKSLMFTITIL